jgi:chemotaxis protein histidine kinase CheA
MTTSRMQRLIERVGRRQFIASLGARWRQAWLGAAAVALAVVCAARLLALLPPGAVMPALLALAAVPFILAMAMTRRPKPRQVARLIDERSGAKELFLTAALIADSPGEFQPIVVEQAEQRAGEIEPARIVPFHWQRGARDAALALGVVAAAVWFLPQLDPFKREAARQKLSQQEQRLIETKKVTEVRREQLATDSGKEAAQVKQALAQLEKTFKEAKPQQREANLKQLGEHQKELGELWRKVNNDQLRNAFDKAAQSFGQADPKKMEQWREQLKQGDTSALKKELQEIRDELRKLAEQPDSAEKRAQQEQLAQRLNEMAQGMKQLANSPQASQALQRALEQMDLSKLGQLSKEATQAAMDSLNLSQQELDQLAQSFKDGKALEEALKNLQMVKQLADKNQLDGSECKDCNGMGDYAKLFAAKCNGSGNGAGQQPGEGGSGMGPGIGNGAKRPEDESTETAFKQQKSSSPLAGGKLLLEWKTKEVGETGARTEDYRDAVAQVKQGVAEAIQQEQVPPGYHDAIKRYFDTLPEKK